MSLLSRLQIFADHLGIIRIVAPAPAEPVHPAIEMRTIRLDELSSQVQRERAQAMSVAPGELTLELDRVIEAAGIPAAPHGWTVEKLHEAVNAVQASGADVNHVRNAVTRKLHAEGVELEDIVRDAVARDHAIDAFEQFVRTSFSRRRAARNDESDNLKQQLHDIQARLTQLSQEQAIDDERLDEWCRHKRATEDRWFQTLGLFMNDPPVSRD